MKKRGTYTAALLQGITTPNHDDDIIELTPATNTILVITEIVVGFWIAGNDDQHDTIMLQCQLVRGQTGGSGSALTPQPIDPGFPAYSGTARFNVSTGTGGTILRIVGFASNRSSRRMLAPENRLIIPGGSRFNLKVAELPELVTNTNYTASCRFQEWQT